MASLEDNKRAVPHKSNLTLVTPPREPKGWGDSYILWLEDECARLEAEVARLRGCEDERTSRC